MMSTQGLDSALQRSNPYNKFLPYADTVDQDASRYLVEIKLKLRECLGTKPLNRNRLSIQIVNIHKYIALYGLHFNKEDHIFIIKILYGLFTTPNMDPLLLDEIAKVLVTVLKKKYLLSRKDLQLDWKPLFDVYKHYEDSSGAMRGMIKGNLGLKSQIKSVVKFSRAYFPDSATQEMLDRWRPMLCPFDRSINTALKYFELFLPTSMDIPKDKTYPLWHSEFMKLWESFGNSPSWEVELFRLYARLAHHNVGRIDWEPYLEIIFTRVMTAFCLPVTYGNSGIKVKFGLSGSNAFTTIARWIVSVMGGKESSVQLYLTKMLQAIESYYYPANDSSASEGLHSFIAVLVTYFVNRVHIERYNTKWKSKTPDDKKLTDDDISNFVTSLLPISFHILYNNYEDERKTIFNILSTLRPNLILPLLLEKAFGSIETVTEPHRLTACVAALSACSRPLVQNYPMEVIRLLNVLLPGIDVNDIWKSTDIFILLSDLLEMIWLVDFSDPSSIIGSEICEEDLDLLSKTSMFEDFVVSFTDQCLTMIENTSREQTRHEMDVMEESLNDEEIAADAAITDTFQKVMHRSSPKIFKLAFNKIRRYVEGRILEPCVAGSILASMCKSTVAVQPKMALDFFIPYFCNKILTIFSERSVHPPQKNQKIDQELQFVLLLLSEVISIRGLNFITSPGTAILDHMDQLMSLLDKILNLEQKDEYEIAGTILQNLILALVHIRPIQTLTTHKEQQWSKEVYEWGKSGDLDKLKLEWYIPGKKEHQAAELLLKKYMKPNLDALLRLSRGEQTMEKEEVLRRLRHLYKILHGSSELLPPIQTMPFTSCLSNSVSIIHDICLTLDGGHVRQTAVEVLREVQTFLLANSPDDTDSLSTIITIYDVILLSFGLDEDDLNDHMEEHRTIKSHRLNRMVRSKRHLESVLVDRVMVQHETHLWLKNFLVLETLPEQTIFDIFTLSTSHYSEVRTFAQDLMVKLMSRTAPESHNIILPKLIPLLQNDPNVSHQQLKGALYIICCEKFCFFYNWKIARAIMPALVRCQHSDKTSVVDLLKDISIKSNRMYTDFALFTLPVRRPKISSRLLSIVGAADDQQLMDCDEEKSEEDPDYLELELELCRLVREGNLHWRHKQMAVGMLLTILVEDHIPPQEVVDMWLQCQIDDDRTVRMVSFQALECVLKICKVQRKRISLPTSQLSETFHQNGESSENGMSINGGDSEEIKPGVRSDNMWMQYKSSLTPEELSSYWDKPFTVKPSLGFYTWPKPIVKLHMTDGDPLKTPDYVAQLFTEFFTNEEKLEKYFRLNSLEHKKGEDFFSMDKALFYSMLFENFGKTPILTNVLPYMQKLAESHQESDQRVAAELVYGVLRGSRFWSLSDAESMWNGIIPLFQTILNNVTDETIGDWETCLSGVTNKADPNRLRWLYEFLVKDSNESIISAQQGAFKESSYLRLLNKALIQNWKVRDLYQRTYTDIKDHLSHPYLKVRRQIASTVATLLAMDISYDNGASNFGEGFPTKKSFIDEVLPKLNLNFHNPELNGIVKQNGTLDVNDGNLDTLNEASNSSAMDVDTQPEEDKAKKTEAARLLETVAVWLAQYIQVSSSTFSEDVFNLLPFFCQFVGNETDQEVSQSCLQALCFLSVCIIPSQVIPVALNMSWKVMQSTSWKARISILEFVQVFVFTNFMSMCNKPEIVSQTEKLVVELIADETLQVRQKAAKILGGLVHSKFLDSDAQQRLLQYFRSKIRTKMQKSKKNKFQKSQPAEDKLQLAQFHAGILGLCSFVEAYPYDVPKFVPDILIELEKHLHDPQPIPKTIKNMFQEFKRTHMDNWAEHKQKFTDEQLVAMTDLLVSPNYYA